MPSWRWWEVGRAPWSCQWGAWGSRSRTGGRRAAPPGCRLTWSKQISFQYSLWVCLYFFPLTFGRWGIFCCHRYLGSQYQCNPPPPPTTSYRQASFKFSKLPAIFSIVTASFFFPLSYFPFLLPICSSCSPLLYLFRFFLISPRTLSPSQWKIMSRPARETFNWQRYKRLAVRCLQVPCHSYSVVETATTRNVKVQWRPVLPRRDCWWRGTRVCSRGRAYTTLQIKLIGPSYQHCTQSER